MALEYLNYLGEPLQPRRIKILGHTDSRGKHYPTKDFVRADNGCFDELAVDVKTFHYCDRKCNGGFSYDANSFNDKKSIGCGHFLMKKQRVVITI